MKSYKKYIGLIFLIAIATTGLGFAIDSDPPYNSIWMSLFEFTILSLILFTGLTTLYFLGIGFQSISKKLFHKKPS